MLLLLFLTFSALVANPKKTTLHGGQSHSWSAERGKKKKKVWQRPPTPPSQRAARSERKNKKNVTQIHSYRRYASRRYAGGLGPSRIRTRIPTTRQLGQWVSLRKTLHTWPIGSPQNPSRDFFTLARHFEKIYHL